jgi:hypothetical protein
VTPGNARANMDRAIVKTPKPICAALSQQVTSVNTYYYILENSMARHKNIKKLDLAKSSSF